MKPCRTRTCGSLRGDIALARVHRPVTGDKVCHVAHGAPRKGMFVRVVGKRDGRWLVSRRRTRK